MKVVELKPSDRHHRNKRNGMFDNLIFNNVAENSRTFHCLQSRGGGLPYENAGEVAEKFEFNP